MNSHFKSIGNILKQEGTSRYERYSTAVNPNNLKIDNRKLEDLIAYAQRYSKNVLFINNDGRDIDFNESWEFFFKNDVISLIASIATKKPDYYKETYDYLSTQFNNESTFDNFKEVVGFTFTRLKKLNNWYLASPPDSLLNLDLKLYIGSYLKEELKSLKEILFYTKNTEKKAYGIDDFKKDFFDNSNLEEIDSLLKKDNIWEIRDQVNVSMREQIFAGENEEQKLFNAFLNLNKIFDSVFHTTSAIVNSCHGYFEDTIHNSQDHPPHIALFIAFLKLYGYVQEELNKIPKRYIDYYYKEVLQIKAKNLIPDQAFLIFELAKGFQEFEIKTGTAFSAGKDRKNVELIYKSNEDYIVNKGQIISLNTIFIDKNKDDHVLNYYKQEIKGSTGNISTNEGGIGWKMFGEEKKELVSEVGFAIASTQFYLAKGERKVLVSLEYEGNISVEEFDTGIVKLLLTGEKGWLSSDDPLSGVKVASITRNNNKTIDLNFTISITQTAAIIAYNDKIHQAGFNTSSPVLQCILKFPEHDISVGELSQPGDEREIKQLNLLQELQIIDVIIKVEIGDIHAKISFDGVRDLVLQNSESELDSTKPFYPFTALPKVGSSFYIGCKDLYYKKIENLSINIDWVLPDNFTDYYSKYIPPYDSNKFVATLSILRGKYWVKIADVVIIDKAGQNPRYKAIKIDFKKIDELSKLPKELLLYDNERKDGTLMLQLNYPDFGHGIYSQLITSAVMEKASSQKATVDYHKIVKKQLKDSVISIKLPTDIDQRAGSLKVVYDILEKVNDDDRATNMITKSLSEIIRKYNGSNIIFKKDNSSNPDEEPGTEGEGYEIVNDDNFIENILRFLKKVKLIDKNIHYDEDKENAEKVVNSLKDRINLKADIILPNDKELINVIINETNSTINKTIANIAPEIVALRLNGSPDLSVVRELLGKEFNEANEVINDIIARKIALLLSANEIPPPPYSPLISNISVSYTSVKSSHSDGDQFFHVTPFGNIEIELLPNTLPNSKDVSTSLKTRSIFPKALVTNGNESDDMQGMLFIGFKDVQRNQNISVLFEIVEGTKVDDKKPSPISWWYLNNSEWVKLNDKYIVSDSTHSLQTTGIIKFTIPEEITSSVRLFNNNSSFWLCAGVVNSTKTFPDLADTIAQAITVTFRDQNNDPAHLGLPLEAKRITKMVEQVPQIKGILQPVASFGGKLKERDQEYYTRVSERLRHKDRSINNWDYERLVLENFPSIYKVKCLNNYYNGSFNIGHVTVVPIPDLRNKSSKGTNQLVPKASYIELRSIEKFLRDKASPFVKIHAVNPQLDHVLISCRVKFHKGVDKGFYLQKLNKDLIDYLTPWAQAGKNVISFSTKIYTSNIVNFIDSQEYINYISDPVMQQYSEDEFGNRVFCREEDNLTSLVETQLTSGHSIIVSAAQHAIELLD